MTGPFRAPILFVAFDRPDYFEQVLRSVRDQVGVDLSRREVWLFEDGSIHPISRAVRGAQARIDESIRLFRGCFPDGKVFDAPYNLGVALNFERAERYAFEERANEACIFLEDDMVLSPHYIRTLDRMIDLALADDRIGYVAAYGHHLRPLAEQRRAPGKLVPLGTNWAFALTRTQWRRNQPYIDQYLALIRDVDYPKRDNRRIFDLYSGWGQERAFSSQDRAKMIACCLTGGLRVNTTACLAKYIGRVGVHSHEAAFISSRYDATEVFLDGPLTFDPLSDQDYRSLLERQTAPLRAVAPSLCHDVPMGFARGAAGVKALRHGFHPPDAAGVWSGSLRSELELRIEATGAGCVALDVTAAHGLPAGVRAVRVAVSCNDVPCGTLDLTDEPASVRINIPQSVAVQPVLALRFTSPLAGRRKDGMAQTLGLRDVVLRRG